jgi:hypothetical protein
VHENLVIQEAIADDRVQGEETTEERLGVGLEAGFGRLGGFCLREERFPIGGADRGDEAIDLCERATGGWRAGALSFADACGATGEAAGHGARGDGICPEKFEERERLDTHLVNAAVDVAAIEESQKSRQANLNRVLSAGGEGGLEKGTCNGGDGVGCDGCTLNELADLAEVPAIVGKHAAFGGSKKLGNELSGEKAEFAA